MVWQLLTWPLDSLLWLSEQVEERAVAELDQTENLQKRLTALQIRFDLGDISESDFTEQEAEILTALEAELDAAAAEQEEE